MVRQSPRWIGRRKERLAGFGGQPLVTLLGDRHTDALALREGDPRLGALADGEDVIQPERRVTWLMKVRVKEKK